MYTPAPTTTHGLAIPAEVLDGQSRGPDLKLFLLAHRTFRREFARLAVAAAKAPAVGRAPPSRKRSRSRSPPWCAASTTITTVKMRGSGRCCAERDPAAAVVLDALEAEHQEIDPLIAVDQRHGHPAPGPGDRAGAAVGASSTDTSTTRRSRPCRSSAGITPRRNGKPTARQHLKQTRAELPMFACIMFDHMTEQEIAGTLAAAPKILGVAVQALLASHL